MQYEISGNDDFGELRFELGSGESILLESGALSRYQGDFHLKSKLPGGLIRSLIRKALTGESFFFGEYTAKQASNLWASPAVPGSARQYQLDHSELMLTAGSLLATTQGIRLKTVFGGLKSFFSGEGAFLIRCTGKGLVFFNAYGAIIEKQIDSNSPLIVDTGHLVAFEPSVSYRLRGSGGLKQTVFSGEGLLMEFTGKGRIWLQTRNLKSLAHWLSPYCRG